MEIKVGDEDLKAAASEIFRFVKKNYNEAGKAVGVCETVEETFSMGLSLCDGAWKSGFFFGVSDESIRKPDYSSKPPRKVYVLYNGFSATLF